LEQHAHDARGAYADETLRAMRKASAAFTAWAAHNGLSALPVEPSTVAAYVDGISQFRAPASLRQAVWAIGAMHRAAGLVDPTKVEVVRLAMKWMARQ
jgi:hypothetical protein